jgi:hypothetical protein
MDGWKIGLMATWETRREDLLTPGSSASARRFEKKMSECCAMIVKMVETLNHHRLLFLDS